MHMILPEVLALLKKQVDQSFYLYNLRKSISGKDRASIDHSGVFDGAQRKCVKIPRRHVDINVVKLIDKAFGDETPESDEEVEVLDRQEKNDETLELLQSQVATEIEHNNILRTEKRHLEETLQSESVKRAKMEERVALLEQELAKKERVWK
ncbi:Hypothetical predicted protein, partial [Paramuricea clavata]